MIETLLGGLIGGVFRLAPECLNFFDKKHERAHELALQDKQIEHAKVQGAQKMSEIGAESQLAWNTGYLDTLKAALTTQARESGVKWIDGLSTLMRPLITLQWVVVLYPGVIVTTFILLIMSNVPVIDALARVFGPEEKALCSGILNFWFLNRVFEKAKL
ncbi:MAG TPA: hypothetical protein VLL97_03720 [Acidobacteriota bacterium]|nr:hypothetical protein [Acidobacteriota bacterium]